MFQSPWAVNEEYEKTFETTIRQVGDIIAGDMGLASLFTLLVWLTPPRKKKIPIDVEVSNILTPIKKPVLMVLFSAGP